MKPYALFFDIDGTLVSLATHRIPQSTIDALTEARRRGARIFIATGRHRRTSDNLGAIAPLIDGYITLNGACCIVGEEVVSQTAIRQEEVSRIIAECDQRDYACVVVGERDIAVHNPKPQVYDIFVGQLGIRCLDKPLTAAEILRTQPILQLTPFLPAEQEVRLMQRLPGCVSGRWHPAFTDITALGADKGAGLASIVRHLGLAPARTIAFGDGGNDLTLLRRATIGVAMGNAVLALKAAADYVTTDIDDDGISHALRHLGVI